MQQSAGELRYDQPLLRLVKREMEERMPVRKHAERHEAADTDKPAISTATSTKQKKVCAVVSRAEQLDLSELINAHERATGEKIQQQDFVRRAIVHFLAAGLIPPKEA